MPTNAELATATGFDSLRISRYWPTLVSALTAEGIAQEPVLIATAGTLRAELGTYLSPRQEAYNGNPYDYFETKYGAGTKVGATLGNTVVGDGYKYRGRGFIQLTGKSNYASMTRRLGVDLLTNPDLALDPYTAARVFAAFFKDRGVADAAIRGDWRAVRRIVNGGYNGWDDFIAVVQKLGGAISGPAGSGGLAAIMLLLGSYLAFKGLR